MKGYISNKKHEQVIETNFKIFTENRKLKQQLAIMYSSFRRIHKTIDNGSYDMQLIEGECVKHLPKRV